MKNYFKRRYALSEQGAKNVTTASLNCTLTYFANLAPMFILMIVFDQLILGNVHATWQYSYTDNNVFTPIKRVC